jgi:hypothetical protein
MERWSFGVLEYWEKESSLVDSFASSITPLLLLDKKQCEIALNEN